MHGHNRTGRERGGSPFKRPGHSRPRAYPDQAKPSPQGGQKRKGDKPGFKQQDKGQLHGHHANKVHGADSCGKA